MRLEEIKRGSFMASVIDININFGPQNIIEAQSRWGVSGRKDLFSVRHHERDLQHMLLGENGGTWSSMDRRLVGELLTELEIYEEERGGI